MSSFTNNTTNRISSITSNNNNNSYLQGLTFHNNVNNGNETNNECDGSSSSTSTHHLAAASSTSLGLAAMGLAAASLAAVTTNNVNMTENDAKRTNSSATPFKLNHNPSEDPYASFYALNRTLAQPGAPPPPGSTPFNLISQSPNHNLQFPPNPTGWMTFVRLEIAFSSLFQVIPTVALSKRSNTNLSSWMHIRITNSSRTILITLISLRLRWRRTIPIQRLRSASIRIIFHRPIRRIRVHHRITPSPIQRVNVQHRPGVDTERRSRKNNWPNWNRRSAKVIIPIFIAAKNSLASPNWTKRGFRLVRSLRWRWRWRWRRGRSRSCAASCCQICRSDWQVEEEMSSEKRMEHWRQAEKGEDDDDDERTDSPST